MVSNRQMTIGIDATPATRAVKTGTEFYTESLILELARLKLPHNFVLYSRYAPFGELAKLPSNFTWKVMPFPFLWSQVRLAVEFLLHPSAVDVMFFPAHVMPLVHPRHSVITLHDIGFEHFPELYGRTPIGITLPILRQLVSLAVRVFTLGQYGNSELDYHRWATRFALKHAAGVITISKATKRDILKHFAANAEPVVIYHGINPEHWNEPLTIPEKLAQRIKSVSPYILFVGRIEAKKNVTTLIKAFGELAKTDTKTNLVLVGRPSHGYADVADAIQQLPDSVKARVHELGYVFDDRPWMQHAAVFAFPSAFEGFGLPPLEAMATGIPVVAANGTSLPEIVGDGGLLVDTYSVKDWTKALSRVLTDKALRSELIRKGHAHVKTFTWEKTARQTLAVLESVAKGTK